MKKMFIGLFLIAVTFVGCEDNEDVPVYHQIDDVFVVNCPEPPIVIMSNQDDESVARNERVLGYHNIVQVKEDLYYMYYEAMKDILTDFHQKVCFAYSSDCIHWTKRFLNSTDNNNVIIQSNISGMSVTVVPDDKAPFRMFGLSQKDGGGCCIAMWKSSDGISFTDRRELLMEGDFDTQSVGIVKGGLIKLYTRTKKGLGSNRKISVAYIDFDGNVIHTPMVLQSDHEYNSAASSLSEKYDLLFPTHFNNVGTGSDAAYVETLICTGYDSKKIACNINDWIGDDEPWMIVAPGIINIGGEQYVSYYTHTWSHDTLFPSDGVSKIKLMKISVK